MFKFPYTNFHDLNLDWILCKIKELFNTAVFTVNNTAPDENGNVNLSGVSGVTSVNGVGADGSGNVQLQPYNLGLPAIDYFVDTATGDDSNTGRSYAQALKTINAVFTRINAYAPDPVRIHIKTGSYNECITRRQLRSISTLELIAESGTVTCNGISAAGANISLYSDSPGNYGWNFNYNSNSPSVGMLQLEYSQLHIRCHVSVDCGNARLGFYATVNSEIIMEYNSDLTVLSVSDAHFGSLVCSRFLSHTGSIVTNVANLECAHAIVQNLPSAITITGTALSI